MAVDNNSLVKPRFARLWNSYPTGDAHAAIAKIGGQVAKGWNWDGSWGTCAVRVSHSLNLVGAYVPSKFTVKGGANILTYEGANKRRYALRVRELEDWLRAKWGPHKVRAGRTAAYGVSYRPFSGKSGIMIFDPGTVDGDYFGGHIDLWDGAMIANHSYFHATSEVRLYEFI